jgi:hypothetical protein
MPSYEMLKKSNLWQDIPHISPYVLSQDKRYVDLYNEPLSITDESYLHSELYPEQYAGRFNAKVVLLGKCPGFSPEDESVHKGKTYKNLWEANISQTINDYPLFFLHPAMQKSPCYRWWYKKLKALIDHTSVEAVANEVLEVQLFPYHCKKLRIIKASKAIPSRGFANKLVSSAIQRDALIIVMESERLWKEHVPALRTYSTVYTVNSVRSGAVSPGNLPNVFHKNC